MTTLTTGADRGGMLLTMAVLQRLALEREIPCPEVIVPANVHPTTVGAMALANLTPVFVDVRPGLYVLEAERAAPAIIERTVAIIAPCTYGNVPELDYLARACLAHDVPLVVDATGYGPGLDAYGWIVDGTDVTVTDEAACARLAMMQAGGAGAFGLGLHGVSGRRVFASTTDAFWAYYGRLAPFGGHVAIPFQINEPGAHEPRWSCFPLIVKDEATADAIVAVHPAAWRLRGCITRHPAIGGLGPWMRHGDLLGAQVAHDRGVAFPLALADLEAVAAVLERLA